MLNINTYACANVFTLLKVCAKSFRVKKLTFESCVCPQLWVSTSCWNCQSKGTWGQCRCKGVRRGFQGPLNLTHKAGLYGGQTDEVSRASCHWVQSNDWPSLPLPNSLIVLSMFGCGHSLTLWGVRITLSPPTPPPSCHCVCVCVHASVFILLFPIYIDSQ